MWVSDGSPELKISENGIECTTQRSTGEIYNAVYHAPNEQLMEGTHCWRIKVNSLDPKDSIWVGITDLEKFKPGWAFRGLMYGGPGNLSNGGALLASRYGPRIKSEDVVGINVTIDSSKFKVSFEVNNVNLGLAFDLPRNVLSAIMPAIRFGGNSAATIEKLSNDQIPANSSLHSSVQANKDKIFGVWKLSQLKGIDKPEGVEPSITLNPIADEPNGCSSNLRVINKISFNLDQDQSNGKWSHSHLRMTRVAGSPDEMKFETEIKELVTNPDILAITKEGLLRINRNSLESSWDRIDQSLTVTQNPFD